MTIEDINYLKENSVEDIHKLHFKVNSNNTLAEISTISNVFAINIIKISSNTISTS